MPANSTVRIGDLEIANDKPFTLIAGPCQLETRQHAFDMAGAIKEITAKLGIGFIYKTSFDKANRTSRNAKRGLGLELSLPIFEDLKKEFGVPVLTDVHEREQCAEVASVVDVLQIPAFLCRQTDLLEAAAAYTSAVEGRPHFSPPQIMRKLSVMDDAADVPREERMRVFGRLLRQGKITKVKRGQYAITEASRYWDEAKMASGQ
mgnify:CR=1 FL=1